jgi:S-formylglutathione hydrolase FrmB
MRIVRVWVVGLVVSAVLVAAVSVAMPPVAAASPQPPGSTGPYQGAAPDGSRVVRVIGHNARHIDLWVHSTAMAATYAFKVQLPQDTSTPAPVLYLLNGVDAGLSMAAWSKQTDVLKFLAAKHLYVVQPIGGKASYYTDWLSFDPVLGQNKWRTYLADELPPLIDGQFRTNGRNAIAGTSMSATSVLQLAESHPGLYHSVASYSGCAQISDPLGQNFVRLTIGIGGLGGNADNMYGDAGNPLWQENDPYVHADRLRGTRVFLSAGTGWPGPHDTVGDKHTLPIAAGGLPDQVIIGGLLEAIVHYCTVNLRERLIQLRIPATYDLYPAGSHSWGYWQDAFKDSWPTLAAGLGLAG